VEEGGHDGMERLIADDHLEDVIAIDLEGLREEEFAVTFDEEGFELAGFVEFGHQFSGIGVGAGEGENLGSEVVDYVLLLRG